MVLLRGIVKSCMLLMKARHYCQTDNVAIHVHCDLVANQSLMAATTEAGAEETT